MNLRQLGWIGIIVLLLSSVGMAAVDFNTPAAGSSVLFPGRDFDSSVPSGGSMLLRTLLALLVVVGLGGMAVYVAKRWLPQFGQISGKEIQVIETVGLGPRKSLHLVEVGGKRLLIGSTPDRITHLASLAADFNQMVQTQYDEAEG